ncbi:MAG: hypothetical protein HDT50_01905 [Lactobacillus sp.]|nr:hypothetical protein [Lactobacillus sp.]
MLGFVFVKLLFATLFISNIIWCLYFIYQFFYVRHKYRFLLPLTFIPIILLSALAVFFAIHVG